MGRFAQIARGEAAFKIIGNAKKWAAVSGVLIALGLVGIFGRGLNLGLEFKGGTSITVPLKTSVTVPGIENSLRGFALGDVKVQIVTDRTSGERQALVRTKHIASRDVLAVVQSKLAEIAGLKTSGGRPDVNAVSLQDVGPTWGKQVSGKALRGLIVFLILVTLYISVRFEAKMAVGALVAVFHDLIVTAGLYALIGFVVTPATVVALLTLLGYSLYDTVVVFDKVRENAEGLARGSKTTYSETVNRSVNQVLMRSINTSLSALLPIGALLFVGVYLFKASTLEDLALALFLGTIVGAYSSIFVASPILAVLKEREPRYRAIRARIVDEGRGSTVVATLAERAPVSAAATEAPDGTDRAEVGARERTPAGTGPRPRPAAPRSRGRKRGGKGRRR